MIFVSDHPDIASAMSTGYSVGTAPENADTAERRLEFAKDYMVEFISFAKDGDPDILDHFADYMGHDYKNWLN